MSNALQEPILASRPPLRAPPAKKNRVCGKWVVGWSGDTNEDKQGHRQTPVMGYLSLWCTFLGPHSEAAHLNAG